MSEHGSSKGALRLHSYRLAELRRSLTEGRIDAHYLLREANRRADSPAAASYVLTSLLGPRCGSFPGREAR